MQKHHRLSANRAPCRASHKPPSRNVHTIRSMRSKPTTQRPKAIAQPSRLHQTHIINEMPPLNSTDGPVRVRFAPSPTGTLHLGGLRTALYNYLFAKKRGGEMILRIEDTDRTRLVPGALESLISDMHWAGIQYDEGPPGIHAKSNHPSNPHAHAQDTAPYIQSERFHLYQEGAQQLIDSGHAYHCFCSAERLDSVRESRAAKGEPIIYDRLCASLTPEEVAAHKAAGESYVIRMKMPDGVTHAQDLVRGEVKFQNSLIDDQVLIKSDGFPTYHLANIIDDHMMGITHVIRGEEWLPSLPKHIALYKMFGWDSPQFAHLPLLLREQGGKLSKRFKDSSMNYYVEQGFLPEALINFVALLGWHPTVDDLQHHARTVHGIDINQDNTTAASATNTPNDAPAAASPDQLSKLSPEELRALLTSDKIKLKQKTSQLAKDVGSLNEVFTVDELASYFDINNMQKSGATVELNKLHFFQSQHWKRALNQDIGRLEAYTVPFVQSFIQRWKDNQLTEKEQELMHNVTFSQLINDPIGTSTRDSAVYDAALQSTTTGLGTSYQPNQAILAALRTTRDHPGTLQDFPPRAMFVWARPDITTPSANEVKQHVWTDVHPKGSMNTPAVLHQLTTVISTLDDSVFDTFDVAEVVKVFKTFAKANKLSLKDLYLPLRFVLTGSTSGPGVADQILSLGKEEANARIAIALSIYDKA